MNTIHLTSMKRQSRPRSPRGFSLLELLVAMALFLIISSAAFLLFKQHAPLFTQQQNAAGLNVGLRNAIAQLQIDMANAGTGYYLGANIPSFPIGITVSNSSSVTSCYDPATHIYSASCFDTLHVIVVDPNTPPLHPSGSATTCVSTTSSIIFANPASGQTPAQTAADFSTGDQLLLVKNDGSQMTTVVLTQNGGASGPKVQLQHNPTGADGTNSSTDDPLGISLNPLPNNKLGSNFCDNDWVLKITPVTYTVDTTDPNNPKLMRKQGGTSDVVMDQVIGFRVGVTLWDTTGATSSEAYDYQASDYSYDYSRIRSVRVALIGRTPPTAGTANAFRNDFDKGPYQIQAASVVVNPRNLSMKD